MTDAPRIETERLVLRGHVLSDFPPIYDLFATDRSRFMTGPRPARDMWFWVASEVGSWTLMGHGSWGIERAEDGVFVGQVGLNQPYHYPEPEIGWMLLDGFEGKGYAREAARAALDWWWARPDAASLVSYIHPENRRSIALAERLGAVHDPDAAIPDRETPMDTVVYRHRRPQ